MADDFQEDIRISELPEADSIDKDTDFLAVVKPSTLYTSGFKSFKVKASKLPGGGGGASSADDVTYDNSVSGLEADNVQEALDELAQSSGGSTVEVTQVQTTGTKIATITVDSVGTDLYAPNGGGASAFEDLIDVDIDSTTLSNGQVPIYNSTSEKWENGTISSGSGHTIVDNEGVSLTQRDDLQFKGAYSEDDSTDEKTVVNVVREMTKAEFDELTEEEKTGFINITDITGGNDDRFQPVIYSEDEREIGVWTDGKPLYQKTFLLSQGVYLPQDQWVDTGCYLPNAEQIIASDLGAGVSGISGIMDVHTAENYSLYAMNMRNATVQLFKFTVQYTKSTDQAGSGQWTPQGVPTHHYSEDEQVVGTWIDGSTVYEKTFIFSGITIPKETWTTVANVSTLNIDRLVSVFGNGSGASQVASVNAFNDSGNLKVFLSFAWGMTSITIRYTKSST